MSGMKQMLVLSVLFMVISTASFALGVAPSRITDDFGGDINKEYSFKIINSEHRNIDVLVYPRGDLAKYILVNNNMIHLSADQNAATVSYRVTIPFSVHVPGINLAEIVVEETTAVSNVATTVGGKIAVVHQLRLQSEQEGAHIKAVFSSNDPDFDQELNFVFALFNDGTEDIPRFDVTIDISDSNGDLVESQAYILEGVQSQQKNKQAVVFTDKPVPGEYRAKATIHYGGKSLTEEIRFVIGRPHIIIEGIGSDKFVLGEINKIYTSLYNPWYKDIPSVTAEFIVKDSIGSVRSIFRTAPEEVDAFNGKTVYGYWDTGKIQPGEYSIHVRSYYDQYVSDRIFKVNVLEDEFAVQSYPLTGSVVSAKQQSQEKIVAVLVVMFIILVLINILLLLYIRKRRAQPPQL